MSKYRLLVRLHDGEDLPTLLPLLADLDVRPIDGASNNTLGAYAHSTGQDLAYAMYHAHISHQNIIGVTERDGREVYIHPKCVYAGSCRSQQDLEIVAPEIARHTVVGSSK